MFNRSICATGFTPATFALALTLCGSMAAFAQSGGSGSGAGGGSAGAGASAGAGGATGQDTRPAGSVTTPDATAPGARAPQTDVPPGGSGGSAGSGDPLSPGNRGNQDASEVRSPNSISAEPERVKRGGGASGKKLEECMQNWDAGTHMTKEQWKATCVRLGR